MVDLKAWVDVDEEELGINEKVYYPVLEKILEENTDIEEIKQMISTIWATVVSVRSASCFRTSTVSVCPVWSVWYVSV